MTCNAENIKTLPPNTNKLLHSISLDGIACEYKVLERRTSLMAHFQKTIWVELLYRTAGLHRGNWVKWDFYCSVIFCLYWRFEHSVGAVCPRLKFNYHLQPFRNGFPLSKMIWDCQRVLLWDNKPLEHICKYEWMVDGDYWYQSWMTLLYIDSSKICLTCYSKANSFFSSNLLPEITVDWLPLHCIMMNL